MVAHTEIAMPKDQARLTEFLWKEEGPTQPRGLAVMRNERIEWGYRHQYPRELEWCETLAKKILHFLET